MMENPRSPDVRRQGIYALVSHDYGRKNPYLPEYRELAKSDEDFTVRAAAIRASNWARDRQAVPIFIAALSDANALVRWEAAKALSNIPDASAVDALRHALSDPSESRNVRVAAADALRHYRNLDVAEDLAKTLAGKDFSVAWQARQSLVRITGKDLRYDQNAWLAYLAHPDKPLG